VERDVEALIELSRLMVGLAYASLEDRLELRQFRALAFVRQRGGCTVGELAQDSALPSSSTTRLCDQLVERGWLTRRPDEGDRRQVQLELTDAGEACVAEVLEERGRRLRSARRALDPSQRAALSTVLPPLIEALSGAGAARSAWAV
jgi:DNA-binding MarR family transcriptional regulator